MKELATVIRLTAAERKGILLSLLFGFTAAAAAVALFAASGYLVSKAALVPPLYTLTFTIAFLKFISIARAGSRYAERYYSHLATFNMLSGMRVYFFRKLEPLAPGIFQRHRSGDLLSRIVGDVEHLQFFFLRVFYPPLVMLLVFFSTIFFTLFFSFYIALLLLAGLIVTGFVIPAFFAWRERRLKRGVREKRGRLATETAELLFGFRDLKMNRKLEDQKKQLTAQSEQYIGEQEKETGQRQFSEAVNTAAGLWFTWSVLAAGAYFASIGDFNGLFLAMLVMISLTVFENSAPMASFPSHYEGSRVAAGRLEEVLDDTEKVPDPEKGSALKEGPFSVRFASVSYTYPGETRPALKNVSLTIPEGTKTAIVGPSGSGKSTVMQLLLKSHLPEAGEIRLGGAPVTSLTQEEIWEKTNTVLQENHFFYGTVEENLRIAGENASEKDLKTVLIDAGLESLNLTDRIIEKGANLSGGEKQRLAIARAMLKDAPVWVLDEPSSSLDAVTEAEVFEALAERADGDTLILISHRLKGLEKMDQIIVMDAGTAVEAGTYEELMERKGYFYRMKKIEKDVMM
ncbi:thiol reductant ABC exporter subunit CydC [Alteribacter natronophilus]|uniref:thiol reductant ABC exporter subunit CydC n=1 Tax=Alteribacter natronophilus TaxID=2583810 RepID=UPI00110DB4D9|nr:thiol reductant ABC exporter subunit CydC [Alteribacter natronophilus]TMW71844.1 thiol reductant ABC exporter subunit CydC [Alteribacter natronophilus]